MKNDLMLHNLGDDGIEKNFNYVISIFVENVPIGAHSANLKFYFKDGTTEEYTNDAAGKVWVVGCPKVLSYMKVVGVPSSVNPDNNTYYLSDFENVDNESYFLNIYWSRGTILPET